LYGFGVIGKGVSHGDLIDSNKITTAAVAVPVGDKYVVEDNFTEGGLVIENVSE
jgi:hypothetical protein